jgi:hypothetical protein
MSDLMGVDVGIAGPEDAGELLALINLVQPHVPWNAEQLRWQFFAPPAGAARLWVLRDGRAIVSLYCAIRQNLRVGADVFAAWMIQDVMSHPAYRGRGFLHHLGQLCFDEIRGAGHAGYTFPNKLSEGSFRRVGWTEAMLVPRRSAGVVRGDEGHSTQVTAIDHFGDVQAKVWQQAATRVGVERDAAFLEWRYRKPGQRYERFAIAGDQGYLVVKLYEGAQLKTLHVCDLVVRPSARELVPRVLDFVHERARALGATRLTAWLPEDHPDHAAYVGAGLCLDADRDRYMFMTGPGSAAPWHVTQGDSDVY